MQLIRALDSARSADEWITNLIGLDGDFRGLFAEEHGGDVCANGFHVAGGRPGAIALDEQGRAVGFHAHLVASGAIGHEVAVLRPARLAEHMNLDSVALRSLVQRAVKPIAHDDGGEDF